MKDPKAMYEGWAPNYVREVNETVDRLWEAAKEVGYLEKLAKANHKVLDDHVKKHGGKDFDSLSDGEKVKLLKGFQVQTLHNTN